MAEMVDEGAGTCPACGSPDRSRPLLRNWGGPTCTSSFHPPEAVRDAAEAYKEWKDSHP